MAIFILVGGTSSALYAVIGGFLTTLGLRPSFAIIATLCILIPPTYLAQRRLTFRSDRVHSAAFPRYIGTQAIGNSIGIVGAESFPHVIASHPFVGFAVVAIVVAATNYFCLKFWAFGTRGRRTPMTVPNAQYNLAKPDSMSIRVATMMRKQMFQAFIDEFTPQPSESLLDIGVTSDQSYTSSNYLEVLYPYKDRVTAVGIDDASFLETLYPGMTFKHANALALPFEDASFDLVHSSAVLEHVGSAANQAKMVDECLRVARRGVCITTPNRWFPVEVHTQVPLVHWLPKAMCRAIYKNTGYAFFADEANLNLTTEAELRQIMARFPTYKYSFAPSRLWGWTSNLVLMVHKS
jgi:ubiquinone/menaquinone biosynthesis C-methylase UbiE/putative flippase GtrA